MRKAIIEFPSTKGELVVREYYFANARIVLGKDTHGKPVNKICLYGASSTNRVYINQVHPSLLEELLEHLNKNNVTIVDINKYKRYSELPDFIQQRIVTDSKLTLPMHMTNIINFYLEKLQNNQSDIDNIHLIFEKYAFKILPKENMISLLQNEYLCISNPDVVANIWSKTLYFPYHDFPGVTPLNFFTTLIKNYNKK